MEPRHFSGGEEPSAGATDDLLTVAAIGVLAFIAVDLAHEVVGHGIGLLVAGGRYGSLTTTRLIYPVQLPDPNWRFFDLGGPGGNLAWAGVCFLGQRLLHSAATRLRVFLWTGMTFSLCWEFAYFMKVGVTGHGDTMALVEGLHPAWAWRALLFLAGLILYNAAIRLASSELHFVLSAGSPRWRPRLMGLLWTVYLAAGAIACLGATFDPRGRMEMLKSGALSSLGSGVGFFFVPMLFPSRPEKNLAGEAPVRRSFVWILLAAAASVFFVGILGPGIRFSF